MITITLGFFTILLILLGLHSIGYLCQVFCDFLDDFSLKEFNNNEEGKLDYIKKTLKGNFEFVKYIDVEETVVRLGVALAFLGIIIAVFGLFWTIGILVQSAFI